MPPGSLATIDPSIVACQVADDPADRDGYLIRLILPYTRDTEAVDVKMTWGRVEPAIVAALRRAICEPEASEFPSIIDGLGIELHVKQGLVTEEHVETLYRLILPDIQAMIVFAIGGEIARKERRHSR